jgi:hypothetical protein
MKPRLIAAAPAIHTFEQWRSAMGLGGEWRNSHGRTYDDPDGDDRKNLMEYLFGSDPLSPDSGSGLSIFPSGTTMPLQWPDTAPGILDAWSSLKESTSLAEGTWGTSPLIVTSASGNCSATETRGGTARCYRVAGETAFGDPAPLITCWGDSLTGNPGTYAEKLPTLLPGCSTQTSTSIAPASRLSPNCLLTKSPPAAGKHP